MGYVHLGSDVTVHSGDIIGIFDIERVTVNPKSGRSVNDYLRIIQKSGRIYYVSLDLPKSFTITDESVYVSNVSTLTLKKRCKEIGGKEYG
jgi:hypothetical protein